MYPIIDWEIDEAGKYRVRTSIRGNTVMFKYTDFPTQEQVDADAAHYEAIAYAPEPDDGTPIEG